MEYPSSISNIKKYLDGSIKIIQKYQKSGCEIMIALDEERILEVRLNRNGADPLFESD